MNALLLILPAMAATPDTAQLRIASYTLTVPVEAGASLQAGPRPLPSPEADAMAWLDRAVSGDRVRYGPFLGADRLRFTRDLAGVLAARTPTEVANYDALVQEVWDRNGNLRLSQRELTRGDAVLRAWVMARAASTLFPSPLPQVLRPPPSPNALILAWQTAPPQEPAALRTPTASPHQDKLAALIEWTLDYGREKDKRRAASLDTDLGSMAIEVDILPGPESTLRLWGPDGRSWWDGGRVDVALDGTLDLISGDAPFAGAEWDSVSARWMGYPDEKAQWTWELLVDAAHGALPVQRQVAEAIRLEPDVVGERGQGLEPGPQRALGGPYSWGL
jgi:hypothetical protein